MISKNKKVALMLLIAVGGIIAWAPWITEEYAVTAVETHLGGPGTTYNYLGEDMTVAEVPKTTVRVPFVMLVYFPSEAMFIVTFWGGVI
jgi:hypothetical protein